MAAIPKLPGNNFDMNIGKEKFHKSHHFDLANNVSLMVGEHKPGIGGEPLAGQDIRPKRSVYPHGQGSKLPSWVAFDKQVLCFDAYFQESVNERREEQYRVRPCKVYFYLEDDSIQVVEPRTKNSQMPQGTVIKRHRIPRPAPCEDLFFNVDDFNVGKQLTFYGRTLKLTDCDEFTKNFLTKIGKRVACPDAIPEDPYTTFRKSMDESMQPLRPYERKDTLKQFLDHDRHVLRFYAFFDDTGNMFGDVLDLILHYFLADDTIEIREAIPPNSGKDTTSCFLRRGKLPKDIAPVPLPGQQTERTVLNVFGPPRGHGGRHILDSLKTGSVVENFYHDSDLAIGAILNVYGRKITLVDCDEFTKHYYRTKYGVEEFTPIIYKPAAPTPAPKEFPPYTGFGSEEDSLCSCQPTLQPKPPQRDFVRFMLKDSHGLESNILRFYGKLITDKAVDTDRRFIISYFLSDDTLLIFEPVQRNSGHLGGKFLERQRVKKPSQERFSTTLSDYYKASDFFIGQIISINEFAFEIIDCDEYAFEYMENHAKEYPFSDITRILQILKEVCSQYGEDELHQKIANTKSSGSATLHYGELRQLVMELTNGQLTEHEIMTVARYYGRRKEMTLDVHLYSYLVQEVLRKHNFDIHMNKIPEAFLQRDAEKCDHLPVNEIMAVLKSAHVPAPIEQLQILVNHVPRDEMERINYQELLRFLNWKQCPVPPPTSYKIGEEDPTKKHAHEAVRRRQERVCDIDSAKLFDDIKPGCPTYKKPE